MWGTLQAIAQDKKSANITMTETHLIIKGKHYQLHNWYIGKSNQNISIPMNDILSIEYITIRSKQMLILLIILLFILESVGSSLHDIAQLTHSTSLTVLFYALLIGSAVLLFGYILHPYRFFKICAIGQTVAVKRKYYNKFDLESLLNQWKYQL